VSYPTYAPNSHLTTCPAGTGELDLLIEDHRCRHYRDGAHRCREERAPHRPHRCTCGAEWLCLPPTYAADRLALDTDVPASVLHRPRHAA
jgi:hypothetical protein